MRYEYQGIKLGDSIEKIIDLLNNENISRLYLYTKEGDDVWNLYGR